MGLVLKIAAGIILAIVLLAVGCSALVAKSVDNSTLDDKAGTVLVSAPDGSCWSGAFGDRTVEGCGEKSVKVDGTILVANAQKQDAGGWTLRLQLRKSGEVIDTAETSAEYGVVSVDESGG